MDNLSDVETADMNKIVIFILFQTVDALEESNKHIDEVMKEMEAKDWQNVLLEAQKKYELEWPQDD